MSTRDIVYGVAEAAEPASLPSLGAATSDLAAARAEAEQQRQRADALAALVDRQAHQLELTQQALLRQQQICSDLLDRHLATREAA